MKYNGAFSTGSTHYSLSYFICIIIWLWIRISGNSKVLYKWKQNYPIYKLWLVWDTFDTGKIFLWSYHYKIL